MAETAGVAKQHVGSSSNREGKYLTFTLADLEYGIANF
jgi:hypothetical protein